MSRLALLALALVALAGGARARTRVVVIGNDHGRTDELPLRFAERDARQFARVMQRLGGVRAEDLVVLAGATAQDAQQALSDVIDRLDEAQSLVVYYSGHADASGLHLGETTLPYDTLKAVVASAPAAVRVLVLDGCRSGGLTRVKGARAAEPFEIALEAQPGVEGMAIVTSSAAGEDSHESDALEGSFFTHHLLAAMLGAGDADRDLKVTLNEAYTYAYRNTLRASGRTARLQHPTYAYDLKGRGDFVLTRLDPGPSAGRLRLADARTYLVHDHGAEGALRAEVTPESADATLVLPAGEYFVQARAPDHYREYQIEIPAGGVVALADEPFREVAYARLVRKGAVSSVQGIFAAASLHGSTLAGRGPTPGALLAWSVDLPWATLAARGRFAQRTETVDGVESQVRTLGFGVTAERVADLRALSLSLGLSVEGLRDTQTFTRAGPGDRAAWGFAFGVLGALEVPLFDGVSLRAEGGPLTQIARVAVVDNGAQVGDEAQARFVWWAALGTAVRF